MISLRPFMRLSSVGLQSIGGQHLKVTRTLSTTLYLTSRSSSFTGKGKAQDLVEPLQDKTSCSTKVPQRPSFSATNALVDVYSNVQEETDLVVKELHPTVNYYSTSFSEDVQSKSPVVVLYGWLGAKKKHLNKFRDLYLSRGFDVIVKTTTLAELLRPPRSNEALSCILDMLTLELHREQPVIVHGFSVGAYLQGLLLTQMNNLEQYNPVQYRIIGQIFDSPFFNIEGVDDAGSKQLPDLPLIRPASKVVIRFLLQTVFYEGTTKVYYSLEDIFYSNRLKIPLLMLYSSEDKIATQSIIENTLNDWDNKGVYVQSKMWTDSGHVQHFLEHKEEYVQEIDKFLSYVTKK